MKAKELADKLMENPNFEVRFVSAVGGEFMLFEDVDVDDIGFSAEVINLGGKLY